MSLIDTALAGLRAGAGQPVGDVAALGQDAAAGADAAAPCLVEAALSELRVGAGEPVVDMAALWQEAARPYLSWKRVAQQGRDIGRVHDVVLERLLLGNMLINLNVNQLVRQSGLRRWDFYVPAHGRLYQAVLGSDSIEEVMDKGYKMGYLVSLIGDYCDATLKVEDKRWSDWFSGIVASEVRTPCPKAPDTWIARGMAERLVELARLRRGETGKIRGEVRDGTG